MIQTYNFVFLDSISLIEYIILKFSLYLEIFANSLNYNLTFCFKLMFVCVGVMLFETFGAKI